MKFGIINAFPPASLALERMRLAERLGFDTFWITDSHVIWNECFSLLGYLAGRSESASLQLGTMVTNPRTRDAMVLASAFATLQDVSGGRMLCGIGRGDSAVRVLKQRPATVKTFEHDVALIRTLVRGDAVETESGSVRLQWATGDPVPVYVAAYGPRVLGLAGRVADGVIIECADPHYIAWALERVHAGAASVGRHPAELDVIISTMTYVSEDLDAARAAVRPFGAVVGNHVAEVMRNNGPDSLPPELEAMIVDRPGYDYQHHARADADHYHYVTDEIIERLCIVGPPERCVARIEELARLGVTHVNFYAQTDVFEEHMEAYSEAVLPQMRAV
jgi:probable F420-dependent oxidoreductase